MDPSHPQRFVLGLPQQADKNRDGAPAPPEEFDPGLSGFGSLMTKRDTRCLDDIQRREIDWLWKKRIARGKLHIWAGPPGIGKSFVACDIAARLSRGLTWPDGENGTLGRVLIMSAQDHPADTLKARLEAAGADCRCIHVNDCRPTRNSTRYSAWNHQLKDALRCVGHVDLVVLDPITQFLTKHIDAPSNKDVSGFLEPLAEFAERQNFAALAIGTFGNTRQSALGQLPLNPLGALAVAAFIFAFIGDPDDERRSRALMLTIKANLCRKADPLAFEIGDNAVSWVDAPSAADVERFVNPKTGKSPDKLELAKLLIPALLVQGPMHAEELLSRLRDQGISFRTYCRAKAELPTVKSEKQPGRNGKWTISLES